MVLKIIKEQNMKKNNILLTLTLVFSLMCGYIMAEPITLTDTGILMSGSFGEAEIKVNYNNGLIMGSEVDLGEGKSVIYGISLKPLAAQQLKFTIGTTGNERENSMERGVVECQVTMIGDSSTTVDTTMIINVLYINNYWCLELCPKNPNGGLLPSFVMGKGDAVKLYKYISLFL